MSHTKRCSLVAFAFAALACACTDGLGPAPSREAVAMKHLSAASVTAGAEVFPFDIIPLVWGGDPRDQLAITVGYEETVAEVCANPNAVPLSTAAGIAVATPVASLHVTTFTHEAFAIVYQYGEGIVSHPCTQIAARPIVATGRVTYKVTTSDALGVLDPEAGGPGAAGVEATAEGVVQLAGGGEARLSAKVRALFKPDGSIAFDEERVRLRPM